MYLWIKGHQQRDRDSIHKTHPSYQEKKRYLSGSTPEQTTSFLSAPGNLNINVKNYNLSVTEAVSM